MKNITEEVMLLRVSSIVLLLALLLTSLLFVGFKISCSEERLGESVLKNAPPLKWNHTYGGSDPNCAYALIETFDGGFAMAGHRSNSFWLVKTNSSGGQEWTTTCEDAGIAYSVIETSDGGYAFTGDDFRLVKTDSTGVEEWNQSYGGGSAHSVIETSDGYALAGGHFYVVKTDLSGVRQWENSYGSSLDYAYSVVEASDGGLLIGGYTGQGGEDADFWVVKVDSDGNYLWNRTYGSADSDDYGSCLIKTSDGGYAIVGDTSEDWSPTDCLLYKLNSTGGIEWHETYGDPYHLGQFGRSIDETEDGGFIIGGTYIDQYEHSDFWMLRVNSTGAAEWNMTIGGDSSDGGTSVIQTSDGGYAIAGDTFSYGAGENDFWLVKLGSDEVHDVAVTDVMTSEVLVEQGSSLGINVTVLNEGDCSESFNVTVYADSEEIETKNVSLSSGSSSTVSFQWGTSDFTPKEYTISAYAWPVPKEADIEDNTCIDGVVRVWVPVHDVAVTGMSIAETTIEQGETVSINVEVANQGNYSETLDLTVYWNTTELETKNLSLQNGSSTITQFSWDTTAYELGYYNVSSYAWPVPGENEASDNQRVFGLVRVVAASENHDIAILEIIPLNTTVEQGHPFFINITVSNQGDYSETFNVSLSFWYEIEAGVQPVVDLPPLTTRTLTCSYNTVGLLGNYVIQASAGVVPGETETFDNSLSYWDANVIAFVQGYQVAAWGNASLRGLAISNSTFEFAVTGPDGTKGILFLYLPIGLNTTTIDILVDGASPVHPVYIFENGTHYTVYLDIFFSQHAIAVRFAEVNRNLAVINLTLSATVIAEGHLLEINATIQNQGGYLETVAFTLSANSTLIYSQSGISLHAGESLTISCQWNTTAFCKGKYFLIAAVEVVPWEMNSTDNVLYSPEIFLTLAGDVDGDRGVDIFDIVLMAGGYGAKPPNSKYNPNCDIDSDGDIDIFDIVRAAGNYGESW